MIDVERHMREAEARLHSIRDAAFRDLDKAQAEAERQLVRRGTGWFVVNLVWTVALLAWTVAKLR